MKTAFVRFLGCVLLGCLLTACPETTVNDDFGLKSEALEPQDWNGAWMPVDDDDTIQLTVVDAAAGVVRMSEPGKKDDKPVEFKLRRASEDEDLLFVLVREGEDKTAKTRLHLLRESEEGVLLLWGINDEAVEKAIQSGQLKGATQRVKNDPHNHLESVPANYAKLLEPQFWNWTEPAILRRVKDRK